MLHLLQEENRREPVVNTLWKERRMTVAERWENSRFENMCHDWKLTEEDRANMLEMKERLKDVEHWKNDPYIVVRYYSEFHGHLPKVEKLFRHMIKWRLDNDIDTHLDRYGTPHPLFHWYPIFVMEGCDKDGDGIYVDRVGMADSYALLKHFTLEGVLDYLIFLNEYINTRPFWEPWEQRNDRHVTKFTVVIDLHGLNIGHIRPGLLPLLGKISRITQDCYPGWAKRIIMANAPSIFKYIWSLAKIFIDQHIRDLFIITNHHNYMEILSEYVDPKVMPPCMTPNGEGRGKPMPGYLENIKCEAGPIPTEKELEEILREQQQFEQQLEEEEAWKKPINFDRQGTALSIATSATVLSSSDMSISTTSVIKGSWEGSLVTASPSYNSLSTLGDVQS